MQKKLPRINRNSNLPNSKGVKYKVKKGKMNNDKDLDSTLPKV